MSSIASIIARGRGTAGAWRVERERVVVAQYPVSADLETAIGETRVVERAELTHYGTVMARWNVDEPADESVLELETGWGSVSDQNGINTVCKALGLPYRMDRDARGGGPRITRLCTCGVPPYPHRADAGCQHAVSCPKATGRDGACTCAKLHADAERKAREFARATPLRPIDGNRFSA